MACYWTFLSSFSPVYFVPGLSITFFAQLDIFLVELVTTEYIRQYALSVTAQTSWFDLTGGGPFGIF
jgi:hypothetical protein